MEAAGRYRIIRRIAQGGMAEVLEAVAGSEGFERRVAIKRILPGYQADSSFLTRFLDEARIASRLHHQNIVAVLDYGIADGLPFQVLEYVDGLDARALESLGRERGRAMPPAVALHVCAEVAHALDHAHRARDAAGHPLGVVHRDVSPHNVLVSWDGDVKLTDFGIAFARDRAGKTATGMALGKLGYMAPEQATGGAVDARTDLFALGCTLHLLLAGRTPLAEETALSRLMTGEALPLAPDLPEDVRSILSRSLRLAKGERWQSALEMAEALGSAAAARTGRDGRSVLREWLAHLRPKATVGRLDHLLDVELLLQPTGSGETEGARRFTSIAATAPSATVLRRAPRERRWILLGAAGLALTAGAIELAPRLLPPAPSPSATAISLAVPVTTPITVAPTVRPAPTRLAHTLVPPRPSPVPSVPSELGALAVGGSPALGAEILVDGRRTGSFAPAVIDLSAGPHEVELKTREGKTIGPKRVEITARNTRLDPYRWIVPGADH